MRPTVLMSTPTAAIHVGTESHTRPSGSPEEIDSSDTALTRRLLTAIRHEVGWSGRDTDMGV
jgi:hypothetical protein